MAVTVTRGSRVEPGERAGHHGRAVRKRFCPQCSTRVSRSANRCGYCGKRLLSRKRIAAIVLLLTVMLSVLAARLTGLL